MHTFQTLQTVIHDGDLSHHAAALANYAKTIDYNDVDEHTQCVVSLFGRLDDGRDICCHVKGFAPVYDLCLEDHDVSQSDLDLLIALLKRKLGRIAYNADFLHFSNTTKRKSNHGFQDGRTDTILSLECANLYVYHRIHYHLRELSNDPTSSPFAFRLVNVDVEPILRFWGDLYAHKCMICGWYTMMYTQSVLDARKQTTCDVEVTITYNDLKQSALPDKLGLNAHFVQLSFDIETFTADAKGDGIDPLKPDNVCICIGVTVYTEHGGFDKTNKRCFYFPHQGRDLDTAETIRRLHADEEDADVTLTFYKSEKEMLEAFGAFVRSLRPDVILGYNSDNFDFWYIYERAKLNHCSASFFNMSKIRRTAPMFIHESTFESPGRGTRRPTILGIFAMDVMIPIRDDVTKRFESYRLADVVKQLLPATTSKYDLSIDTLFQHYNTNTHVTVAEIVKYCMRDVVITQKVATIDVILNKLVEMSNLLYVDVLTLIARGQTIRCISLLYANYTLSEFNYFLDRNCIPDDDIAGGHVGEPLVGASTDPTVVLDFKSLYPSIMMAYNLDFSSIVHDARYKELAHVEYFESECIHPSTGQRLTATFAKTCPGVKHVIPTVLSQLSAKRQAVKKQMKQYIDGAPEHKALNSIQNAIKVTMNSFYGFIGGQKFPIGAFAQTITGQGRNLIGKSKVLVETGLPRSIAQLLPRAPEVIYGDTDSIFVRCPGATVDQADMFGYAVEKFLTKQFTAPIEMEYEKMFIRTVLIRRKNYIYVLKSTNEIKYQGGEQVKRDYCKYFQDAYDVVTHFIFLDILPASVQADLEAFKADPACISMVDMLMKYLIDEDDDKDDEKHDYLQFVRQQKNRLTDILHVLDVLNKKSTDKLTAERETRLAYQPLPVVEASGVLSVAAAVRMKESFVHSRQQTNTRSGTKRQLLLDALTLAYMYLAKLQKDDLDLDTLNALTSSCRLNGRYASPKLAAARGVEKASIAPYAEEEWAIPNLASIHLARRIRARTPGQEPSIGSRFSFLSVLDLDRRDAKTDQLETVEYAIANHLSIDLNAYLDKNGMPFQKLFAVIGGRFACGVMIDKVMKEVHDKVNAKIRQDTLKKNEAAKHNFFNSQKGTATTPTNSPNTFKTRQLKVSKATQAAKTNTIRPLTDFFARK